MWDMMGRLLQSAKGVAGSLMSNLQSMLQQVMHKISCDICHRVDGDGQGRPGGEGGEVSFTEIAAHQEKDGAAEVAMMKGMMKPWIKRLMKKVKPMIKKMLKKMSCNVCEGSRAGGESFKEIIARQEEDDVAEKVMMKGM